MRTRCKRKIRDGEDCAKSQVLSHDQLALSLRLFEASCQILEHSFGQVKVRQFIGLQEDGEANIDEVSGEREEALQIDRSPDKELKERKDSGPRFSLAGPRCRAAAEPLSPIVSRRTHTPSTRCKSRPGCPAHGLSPASRYGSACRTWGNPCSWWCP